MTDGLSILLAISGWGAWLSKEIISKLLDHRLARIGRVGIVEGSARVLCKTQTADGGIVDVDYFAEMAKYPQYSDCKRFRVEIEFQIFNDTDTQIVFTKPQLEFWGVEGVRLRHPSPEPLVSTKESTWQKADAITISSHDVSKVRFEISLADSFKETEELVRRYYGETVVLLKIRTIGGKTHAFRIRSTSFLGTRTVVWPVKKKYPIYNLYSLNKHGRKAGRRPQPWDAAANGGSADSVATAIG